MFQDTTIKLFKINQIHGFMQTHLLQALRLNKEGSLRARVGKEIFDSTLRYPCRAL